MDGRVSVVDSGVRLPFSILYGRGELVSRGSESNSGIQ
jgi:hypothetical protein